MLKELGDESGCRVKRDPPKIAEPFHAPISHFSDGLSTTVLVRNVLSLLDLFYRLLLQ